MKKILFVIDDIFLFVGCLLMIVGGVLVSPRVAIYTAAIECFVLAAIYARADLGSSNGKRSSTGGFTRPQHTSPPREYKPQSPPKQTGKEGD